jgi:hypothetical protein
MALLCAVMINRATGLHDRVTERTTATEQIVTSARLGAGIWSGLLPYALERKYPNASREWVWQFVFPSVGIPLDPRSGMRCRHHLHESSVQKPVTQATRAAGIQKWVRCHTFHCSFSTHLLQNGYDIRTVQELLGAQRCEDNDDLHSCSESRRTRCEKSASIHDL